MAPSPPPQASKQRQPQKRAGRTNGGVKIAGTIIPFDDNDVDLSNGPPPTPLFPPYNPSPPAPLSKTEKAQVASFLTLRSRIHEGPFYTILDNTARVSKPAKTSSTAAAAAANFDPFEGMPTYSQKYIKTRRRLPKLSARPYVLKYFPRELWPTLDPKNYKPSALTNGIEKRTPARRTAVKKEAGNASGEEDEAAGDRDPDEEAINEAVDDEFDEDDDDDAGGDYNAEQYFDDGGEDAGDDMDGDDGGGGGDYY
ncbi:DNA-directed RNA polymerase III subunit C31 [Xanthoria calcicola]